MTPDDPICDGDGFFGEDNAVTKAYGQGIEAGHAWFHANMERRRGPLVEYPPNPFTESPLKEAWQKGFDTGSDDAADVYERDD